VTVLLASTARTKLLALALLGALVAVVPAVANADGAPRTTALAVLAAAVAAGELLELRVDEAVPPLPLSYALFPVVAVRFDAPTYAVTVAAAVVAGAVLAAASPSDAIDRASTRLVAAAAVLGAYRGTFAALAVDEAARRLRARPSALPGRGTLAWLALGSSGALMSLGYRGVDGEGVLGLWGVALFSLPLLATWYSFERLDMITRVSRQTVDALSLAPEFSGIVPFGHADRVAGIAVEMGRALRLPPLEVHALDVAARLHHLGAVTLDAEQSVQFRNADVSATTGTMLRDIATLRVPRSIIEGRAGTASSVLRVANTYDELVSADGVGVDDAIARLRSGAEHAHDAVVVEALVAVVERHDTFDLRD
jgi:hypothetical protein